MTSDKPLADRTDRDIAGVQGKDADESRGAPAAPVIAETPDAPAPDAGEIEWAGGAIRKPPHPGA